MASRILSNSALEIEQTISTGYLALVIRGIGLVRDTGIQNISGVKYFYDTITFYSGLNLTGDFVPSGEVAGNLIPKTDNLYSLGSSTKEWKDGYFDGFIRTDTLHVDENANVSGNLLVSGNITGGGNAYFAGNLIVNGNTTGNGNAYYAGTLTVVGASQLGNATITGDFIPTNFAAHFLPKTDNLYDLGSSSQEVRHLYVDGTGQIDSLVVDENATIASGLSVGGGVSAANYGTTGSGSFGRLYITGTGIPASTGSAGVFGQIVIGSGHIFVCTGTNAWARTHLTGWV